MAEEDSTPRRKFNVILFRRIAAVAACLVLVFSLTTTANAFSFRDVWDAVVTWAQETFSFSMGVEVTEPTPSDKCEYSSLADALLVNNRNYDYLPTYVPEGYVLTDIIVDESPEQETFIAVYTYGEKRIKITVQSFIDNRPEQIEVSSDLLEIYPLHGIEYYIFKNNKLLQAAWIVDSYEYYISAEMSTDELKQIIASIEKG